MSYTNAVTCAHTWERQDVQLAEQREVPVTELRAHCPKCGTKVSWQITDIIEKATVSA